MLRSQRISKVMNQISPQLRKKINQYSLQKVKGLSVHSLLTFGAMKIPKDRKLALSASYLLNELRLRYSHMIWEVSALPFTETSPVPIVSELCIKTLEELFAHPEITIHSPESTVSAFSELLLKILHRHNEEKVLLAQGLHDWKDCNPLLHNEMNTKMIDRGLDAYLSHRITICMLSEQHLALKEETIEPDNNIVGIISKKCSPVKIAKDVSLDVEELFRFQYGSAPKIEIIGDTDLTFSYIPVHIYYILEELVKNSAMAVIGCHSLKIPPIKVIVAQGKEDFCIKVEDKGGGIARTKIDQIWSYAFTTSKISKYHSEQHNNTYAESGSVHDPISGFGFGLPLSRLYARYFGGDLKIVSLDGYGTDAYIFLPRLGNVEPTVPGSREYIDGHPEE